LFFHGNATDTFQRCSDGGIFPNVAERFWHETNYETWSVEYPGYSGCPGNPAVCDVLQSVRYTVTDALQRVGGDPSRLLFIGHSLGAAIMTRMTKDMNITPGAIVLLSAFTGIVPMCSIYAYKRFKWRINSQLLSHFIQEPFPTLKTLSTSNAPVLVVHGVNDDIVPVKDAYELFKKSGADTDSKDICIVQGGHNWRNAACVHHMVSCVCNFVIKHTNSTGFNEC